MVDSVLHPDLAGRCFSSFTKGISLQWTVAEFVQFCCTIIYGKQDDHGTMMFGFFDEDGDGILRLHVYHQTDVYMHTFIHVYYTMNDSCMIVKYM